MTKSSSNIFYPTGIKFKTDYCTILGNPLAQKLMNIDFEYLNGFRLADIAKFPTCPMNGSYELNYTLPMMELDPSFVPSGDHRWDHYFRLPNGKLLMIAQYFVYANGVSFRKT
jgi:hypothetical protein